MNKQWLTVLGALSLVACDGSGVPYDGGAPQLDGWPQGAQGPIGLAGTPAIAGSGTTGGSEQGQGGVGGETDETSAGAGGYEVGGFGGTHAGAGGYEMGGFGGTHASAGGGNGSLCSQNVAQCFDAAANCYQFSPWSDCDQIVDVCAAMQAECLD
jgi:hypothetical protein